MDKTILYLTDNSLEEKLANRCRELLLKASCGLPIVNVSQDLRGKNREVWDFDG
jgi:hypothetical protein